MYESVIQKYIQFLPIRHKANIASMGEGNTPLIRSQWLGPMLGFNNLLFKCEHLNPTGSYKDRFAAMVVSLMLENKQTHCMATSSGNTGSALAAYCTRYGITCTILVNNETPEGKLIQMRSYGARLLKIKGFLKTRKDTHQVFSKIRKISKDCKLPLWISAYCFSPDAMEGVKTIAYELVEQMEDVPDHVFVPIGGGGLFCSNARGFSDLKKKGKISRVPKMNAVQPDTNDTIVTPFRENKTRARMIETATKISGLAVPIDLDATLVMKWIRKTGGNGYTATEKEIWEIQKQLFWKEGLYVEPAGATAVAGFVKAAQENTISKKDKIVCLLTGHGFKDPDSAQKIAKQSFLKIITSGDVKRELSRKSTKKPIS